MAIAFTTTRAASSASSVRGARVDARAAELAEAQARNFARWPVLGVWVWPNAYIGGTYAEEVGYLKDWLRQRAAWIDAEFGYTVSTEPEPVMPSARLAAYPNPTRGGVRLEVVLEAAQHVRLAVYDALGRHTAVLHEGPLQAGMHRFRWEPTGLPAGVYHVRWTGEQFRVARPVTVLR